MTDLRYLAFLALLGAGLSCGGAKPTAAPPPAAGDEPSPELISGSWQWTQIEDRNSIRRIETETWHLTLSGNQVAGSYQRKTVFQAKDGVPFRCAQAVEYALITDYTISGVAGATGTELREVKAVAHRSPCDDHQRELAAYRVISASQGQLVLESEMGRQVLSRAAGAVQEKAATLESIGGRYTWQNRTTTAGLVRVELELWDLRPTTKGSVEGEYLRTVTVFDPAGKPIDCARAPSYTYSDRYKVHGTVDKQSLHLEEVSVEAADNPCVDSKERTLDAGSGFVYPGGLAIVWRGKNRQILHRVADGENDLTQK